MPVSHRRISDELFHSPAVAPLGYDFTLHQLTEGRMIAEFAAEFYRRSGGIHVLGLAQRVGLDQHGIADSGPGEPDPPPAFRLSQAGKHRPAMRRWRDPHLSRRRDSEAELALQDVGCVEASIALPVQCRLTTSAAHLLRLQIFPSAPKRDMVLVVLPQPGRCWTNLMPWARSSS